MPLVSITLRVDQETLSAAKYNSDRNEIVAGLDPTLIEDYSDTATEMRLVADPGEVGTESLPGTLSGELERLRFILKERGGGAQWYTSAIVRRAHGTFSIQSATGTWEDGVTTLAFYRFYVPDSWVAGTDVFLHLLRRASSGSGTSRMTVQVIRVRAGAALLTLASADIDFTPGNTNTVSTDIVATGGSLAAGDFVMFQVARIGADGIDSNTGVVAPDGHYFQWTGITNR